MSTSCDEEDVLNIHAGYSFVKEDLNFGVGLENASVRSNSRPSTPWAGFEPASSPSSQKSFIQLSYRGVKFDIIVT